MRTAISALRQDEEDRAREQQDLAAAGGARHGCMLVDGPASAAASYPAAHVTGSRACRLRSGPAAAIAHRIGSKYTFASYLLWALHRSAMFSTDGGPPAAHGFRWWYSRSRRASQRRPSRPTNAHWPPSRSVTTRWTWAGMCGRSDPRRHRLAWPVGRGVPLPGRGRDDHHQPAIEDLDDVAVRDRVAEKLLRATQAADHRLAGGQLDVIAGLRQRLDVLAGRARACATARLRTGRPRYGSRGGSVSTAGSLLGCRPAAGQGVRFGRPRDGVAPRLLDPKRARLRGGDPTVGAGDWAARGSGIFRIDDGTSGFGNQRARSFSTLRFDWPSAPPMSARWSSS